MLDFSRTQDTNTNSNIQIPKMANTNMTTFRAGSNTLGFAKYFASGTGEDNASTEMTVVSTSDFPRAGISRGRQPAGITSTIGALESG